jgi:trimeric autotransporter adhesin
LDLILAPNQATPGAVIGSDLRRRIPGAPDFRYETSDAGSLYNGLQIRVQRRESNGFRFLTLYTFSKSMDDASAIGVGARNGVVQDVNNVPAEWGLSSFDVRHQLRNWLSYEPPFGERKQWLRSGFGAALLGNWRISTITQISSGAHFTPLLSGAITNGTGALYSQRPDMIGNPVLNQPGLFFNTSAFAVPAVGQFGDARRGSIVGPGFINVDAALGRTFHFGNEGKDRMELRWEVQNVMNMVNYSGLSTVLGSADFGRVKGARPMRSMDMLMRVHF